MHRVIWITGFPGAGKTTTAKLLKKALEDKGFPTILLDGDELRRVFNATSAYSLEERKQLSYQYSRLAKLINEQGYTVIVSTVSLFHEIHQWNRSNIDAYTEVFLDVPESILQQRDQKKLYSNGRNGTQKNVIGVDLTAEIPQKPDIKISNPGTISAYDIAKSIFEKLYQQ